MSNRRRLRSPQHVHAFDQAMAHATELGKEPGTGVVVMDYAAANRQCSWCDCPPGPDNPHVVADYVCGSVCPLPAVYDLHFLVGTRDETLIPTCRGHLAGVQAFLAHATGVPLSVEQYPPG